MKQITKNKKGESFLVGIFSPTFMYAIIVFIIFWFFIKYGGNEIIKSITDSLKQIPGWIYIAIILFVLFVSLKGGRRR